MPSWTADEHTALSNSNDGFSDTATYGVATIYGAFLNEYTVINSVGMASTSPAFLCKYSDVSSAVKGSTITIPVGGTSYTVQENQPDGHGRTVLVLKKT